MVYLLLLLGASVMAQAIIILFLMRQIGFMLLRIPSWNNSGDKALIGGKLPVLPDFVNEKLSDGGWIFIFAASSCSSCRPLLEMIHTLPQHVAARLSLMILDYNPNDADYVSFREKYSLFNFSVMNGLQYAKSFDVRRTPFLLAIDRGGVIVKREMLNDLRQIRAV